MQYLGCANDQITMFVRNIVGTITAYNCSGELKCLKSCIYEKTGIPQDFQQLYFGNKLVTEDMVAIIPNGSNINVCVRLMGGGNSCEICYEKGEYQCYQCNGKMFRSDCCSRFHKHPDRSTYNPTILHTDSLSSKFIPEAYSGYCSGHDGGGDAQLNINDSFDEFEMSDSPYTSQAYQEASMIMILSEWFNLTRFRDYQREAICLKIE